MTVKSKNNLIVYMYIDETILLIFSYLDLDVNFI